MANAQQFNLQLCNWKQFIMPNELLWLLEGDPPFFHEKNLQFLIQLSVDRYFFEAANFEFQNSFLVVSLARNKVVDMTKKFILKLLRIIEHSSR